MYTSLMSSKKRALQEESQKLKLKCFEVSNDLQGRKRKYEMVMGQMWKGSGDQSDKEVQSSSEGGSHSEAYFIIKLAQEREHYRQYVFNKLKSLRRIELGKFNSHAYLSLERETSGMNV